MGEVHLTDESLVENASKNKSFRPITIYFCYAAKKEATKVNWVSFMPSFYTKVADSKIVGSAISSFQLS